MDAPLPTPTSHLELPGWELAWARLSLVAEPGEALAGLALRVAETTRATRALDTLTQDPVVAALRRLFKEAGCDPSRYRPSSEALLRRVLKGEDLPAVHPFVDVNNALSVELAVPSCVMAAGTFGEPVVLRSGRAGEVLDSMRGPLDLEGKPLLADEAGPFGTPITDSHRVKVRPETREAWLVAYLPAGLMAVEEALTTLRALAAESGCVGVE
ncbi:MAG TPA: phenylalanine--tRNA ligase beta subunit-related protein [Thermoanaerobaculia bacterium]|nr:phenylalanine--tRNA ligase beta subunit-related protein [Thermoanaerobaculia bacterium]